MITRDRTGSMSGKESLYCKSVNENGNCDVWLSDSTNSLACGGGKPGQGYACVLIVYGGNEENNRAE